ncbi:GNAT family N-acetyltransferase [Limosilactobacillus fermentum]|uniref:GNAT family N-acetyltransferase n=1 Tax=Limosilactobacillus fermentum TaxID=1613 RepID=UPI0010759571|nr:GNAT family N-acetyltransferase [Limosilactobacillus fermentum]TFZ15645.1 GNAT family N-acetyltransferase [Limosilactobacillus fermentum]
MINYRRLTKTDLPQVIAFYKDACDHQQFDQYSPDWTWGVCPSEQSLEESLNDLFIGAFDDDGTLLGAGILTKGEDPDYPSEAWKIPATDDQIAILHLLVVGPTARGKGVASGLLAQLKQVAKEAGAIVIHLDVIDGNPPADALYQKNGYQLAKRVVIDYEDVGRQEANLYELKL